MKTETIDGVQVTTFYGYYEANNTTNEPEEVESMASLRARILEDCTDADPRRVDLVLQEKEENAARGRAHAMATQPLRLGEIGYYGSIVVSHREIMLNCRTRG